MIQLLKWVEGVQEVHIALEAIIVQDQSWNKVYFKGVVLKHKIYMVQGKKTNIKTNEWKATGHLLTWGTKI